MYYFSIYGIGCHFDLILFTFQKGIAYNLRFESTIGPIFVDLGLDFDSINDLRLL